MPVTTASINAVTQDYANILFRTATTTEQNTWGSLIDSGVFTAAQVANSISSSTEATAIVAPIVRIYQAAFGRAPDKAGLTAWVAYANANGGATNTAWQTTMSNLFTTSTEFTTRYGSSTPTGGAFAAALYQNVLNRTPDAGGLTAWTNALNGGSVSVTQALLGFANSTEFSTNSSSTITTWLSTYATTNTYVQSVAIGTNAPVSVSNATQTLSLNQDILTGTSNVTFSAPLLLNQAGSQVATLQNGDSIVASGTGNILTAAFVGTGASFINPGTISGVQTLTVSNYGSSQQAINGSNISGVTTINDTSSTSGVAIGWSSATAATTAITNDGGAANLAPLATLPTTFTMTNTGATTLQVDVATAALTGSSDAVALTVSGVGNSTTAGTFEVRPASGTNGVEVFNITSSGSATNYLALSQGKTSNNGTLATSAKTITVAGTADLVLTVDNSGDFINITTVDLSNSSGAITVNGAATGGVTSMLNGDTKATTVKMGSGTDTVDLSSQTLAQFVTDTITGGAGNDTIIVGSAVVVTTAAVTTMTSIKTLGILTLGTSTIDMSKWSSTGVTTLKLYGDPAGAIAVNSLATGSTFDTGTSSAFGTQTLALNSGASGANTASTDTMTLNFGNSVGAGAAVTNVGAITIQGFETINVTSVGAATNTVTGTFTATPSAGASETLAINAAKALTLGAVTLSGNGTSISVAGAGKVTLGLVTGVTSINASTSTGGLAMTAFNATAGDSIQGATAAANTIYGSTGNDVLSVGTKASSLYPGGGADVVTLGTNTTGDHNAFFGTQVASSVATTGDAVAAGYFGLSAAAVPGASSSASMSTISGFQTGSATGYSIFTVSKGAWGGSATSAGAISDTGLVGGDGHSVAATANASIQSVTSAGTTLSASTVTLVADGIASYAHASALAAGLKGSSGFLTFSGTGIHPANASTAGNGVDAHMLVAYVDSGTGFVRIADVDFVTTAISAATTTTSAVTAVYASDMVELTGVTSLASLNAVNVAIVA